ncbi:hypothetical protein [Maribacter sp. 2-571]|uniref:hypothetical protein n=1 Tax=Maribacter sp. 2-571 TaxID=3417569 RepID=UPI003D3586FF
MKKFFPPLFLLCALALGIVVVFSNTVSSTYVPKPDANLTVTDNEPFDKMMQVLTHERCVNCHPNDGIPKQGADGHPHHFGIAGGPNNTGFEATNCATCHQSENNPYSGVPGAPEWSLAPASMQWEGLSRTEIATSMMDPERNGGRSPEETMHHLTEHELVLWAWKPGVDADGNPRTPPPVPKEEYIAAVKAWFHQGHIIPSE